VIARVAALTLAVALLPACDAIAPNTLELETGRAGSGAPIQSAPSADIGAEEGILLIPTQRANQFALTFEAPEVRPGGALTAALLDETGAAMMEIQSRPSAAGDHDLSLAYGTLRGAQPMLEARLAGRVVASAPAIETSDGAGGAESLQEPTSVHYYWYESRNGEWVMGVEYDYDLHGGTVLSIAGVPTPVEADRVRFVVSGSQPASAPSALRLAGFDRLVVVD
jgi:hypothetical protein